MNREALRALLLAATADLVAASPDTPLADLVPTARRLALEHLQNAGLDAAAAGAHYEALLALDVEQGPEGLQLRRSRAHRSLGAYYTDRRLVRYLLSRTLPSLLTTGGVPRICDPACGSGAFLAAAAAELQAAGYSPGRVAEALWGCDTDQRALALCRQAVAAAGVNLLTGQLLAADGLMVDLPGGFDLVVGNPPFIASGLRGAAPADPGRMAALRARYPQAAAYKLNTYPLFLQRGIELLHPGGRLAFVLPDSLLLGKHFAGIRRFVLETCCIDEISLIRSDFWPHGHVGQTVLLILQREPDAARRSAHTVRLRRVVTPADLESGSAGHAVSQQQFAVDPLSRFRLIFSDADDRFVSAVQTRPGVRPLHEFLRPYSGLIGRAGQRSLLQSTYPDGRVHVQKGGKVLYAGTPPAAAWRPLLRSGAELAPHRVTWRGERALVEPALLKSGGKRQLYEQPKLLLRQTADRLICAYDEAGLFCLNNIHLLVSGESTSPDELLYFGSLLNSAVLSRYWRLLTLEEGRLYPQIDLDMLALLPLPSPPAAGGFYDDLVQVGRALHALPLHAEQRPGLLTRADVLVAELYGLTNVCAGS